MISTGFFVVFSYMNTKNVHHVDPPSPSLYAFPLPLVFTSGKDLFYLPVLHFERNNLLVYDSYTGDFIETFPYIHVLYPELAHPLHCSPSYHILLLKMTSTGFNVSYSYVYRKFLNHILPPLPSSFTFPLLVVPSP
jgi:hypothetical protein